MEEVQDLVREAELAAHQAEQQPQVHLEPDQPRRVVERVSVRAIRT